MPFPQVEGVRYVAPLREGGSLPAIVDASDGVSYVVKFRGAGQGARALVAEAIVAALAATLDLPMPRPAIVRIDEGFGKAEPDPEIQDLLRWSAGENFGLVYLPGAFAFDPAVDASLSPELAAAVLWFDSLVMNVDRTPRNPNILVWEGRPWLIDHGAALYFHHTRCGWHERSQDPFTRIEEHVLLGIAADPRAADERLRPLLNDAALQSAAAAVPDDWLQPVDEYPLPEQQRQAYIAWLRDRLDGPRDWVTAAVDAWQRGPIAYSRRLTHRVV